MGIGPALGQGALPRWSMIVPDANGQALVPGAQAGGPEASFAQFPLMRFNMDVTSNRSFGLVSGAAGARPLTAASMF